MRALICSYYAPQADRDTGSQRVMAIVDSLLGAGWNLDFAVLHRPDRRYEQALEHRGVSIHDGSVGLDGLLRSKTFDLAVLAYWPVAERLLPAIRRESPGTRVVVESIDVHFLRYARQMFGATPGLLDDALGHEAVGEANTYAAADAVLAVSRKEAALINDLTGEPDLAWAVPLGLPVPRSVCSFDARQGSVFVGNFQHEPNVDAVAFLCREVVPRLAPSLLAEHPLYVVGSGMPDHVRRYGEGVAGVRMVGWVPDLAPYLQHARAALVPLRHGAGVKGKLLEAMASGTPVVSTSIGIEGLDIGAEASVLVADTASAFADAWRRLLTDEALWTRLAAAGRALVEVGYSEANSRRCFLEVVAAVLAKPARPARLSDGGAAQYLARLTFQEDQRMMPRIREVVRETVPDDATVAVLSEGRPARIRLEGRTAWHFPLPDGTSLTRAAGASAVIEALESIRAGGADFLVVPGPSRSALEHDGLGEYFRMHGIDTVHDGDQCRILRLSRPSARPKILVVGVCLTDQPNVADHIIETLNRSRSCRVSQRWAALGVEPPSTSVAAVTALAVRERTPKFSIVNRLLEGVDVEAYDYIVMTDDDIVMPDGFLDAFIELQQTYDFAIAQPARTRNSHIDHPIVEQQRGVLARRTQFVEIGPVVSFHRTVFPVVFPFDLTSPMGWGYENVWSHELLKRGWRMGIVDATPVDHSLRPALANYSWFVGNAGREALWKCREHLPLDECMRVLEAFPAPDVRT